MASRSYLPDADPALLTWSTNFSKRISDDPGAVGLGADDALRYAALHDAFAAAYLAVSNPATRHRAAVIQKNEARAALKADVRLLVLIIQGQRNVTDEQKVLLGINVRAKPTPIPTPANAPGARISAINGRTLSVQLFDPANFERLARPNGVQGAAIFTCTGEAPANSLNDWAFQGNTTRMKCDAIIGRDIPPGTRVWVMAQWYNARGQRGPFSKAISTHVQFGGDLLFTTTNLAA